MCKNVILDNNNLLTEIIFDCETALYKLYDLKEPGYNELTKKENIIMPINNILIHTIIKYYNMGKMKSLLISEKENQPEILLSKIYDYVYEKIINIDRQLLNNKSYENYKDSLADQIVCK